MPLPKDKLKEYQEYYDCIIKLVREFDNGKEHPVVFVEINKDDGRKDRSWKGLWCPCDLDWTWETYGNPPLRQMVTRYRPYCPAKDDAHEVVRNEVREKYKPVWATMSLADAVFDIYQKSLGGEWMGEHNPGTLYVQDVEALLGTTPEVIPYCLGEGRDVEGSVVSPPEKCNISFPSKTILSAVAELQKRKLVDLNGMIFVPHKERFRFPESIHHQFAHWIEEPLGWSNGDAGDGFMWKLYGKIAKATGWKSGEDVFGEDNIPDLTLDAQKRCTEYWLPLLDRRLLDDGEAKDAILSGLTTEQWVVWLTKIREEVRGGKA